MKKTILFMALSALFTMQTHAQLKWGVKVGYNASSMTGVEDIFSVTNAMDASLGRTYKLGFHGGVVMQSEFPFTRFFLQSELLFSRLGVDLEITDYELNKYDVSTRLSYIQLPVYGGYKFDLGCGLDLIVAAGPYFAYGISDNDDAFDTLKRFDFGLSGMAGIQFSRFQFTAGYDLGLVDMMDANGWKTMKDLMGLSSISNRNAKISLVCFF